MSRSRRGRGSPCAFLTDLSILGIFHRGISFAFIGLVRLGGILSGSLEEGRELHRSFSPVTIRRPKP
jgi:hypothetical protein